MSKAYFFLKEIDTSQVAVDRREAVSPTGKWPYYDKAAGRTFESPNDKRRWMIPGKMRETGELVNPNKHLQGRAKSRPDPDRTRRMAWIQSQGGAEGLLKRLQAQRG